MCFQQQSSACAAGEHSSNYFMGETQDDIQHNILCSPNVTLLEENMPTTKVSWAESSCISYFASAGWNNPIGIGTWPFSCSHTQVRRALYCPSRGVNALKGICHLHMFQADPSPVRCITWTTPCVPVLAPLDIPTITGHRGPMPGPTIHSIRPGQVQISCCARFHRVTSTAAFLHVPFLTTKCPSFDLPSSSKAYNSHWLLA